MAQEEQDIWVFAEHRKGELLDVSLELLGEGQGLAQKLGGEVAAILLGHGVEALAKTVACYGARRVYLVEDERLEEYECDAYVQVIAGLVERHRPRVLLAGSTWKACDFLPYVAARMGMAFSANYSRMTTGEKGALQLTRPIYGGRLDGVYSLAPDRAHSLAVMARPGAIGMGRTEEAGEPKLIRVDPQLNWQSIRTKAVEFIKGDPKKMDISQAEIIVAAGRGIDSAEKLAPVEALADVLGASIAGTRPAVDAGLVSFERQVGQTGKSVSPKLYIACGISGAIQHTAGMKDSERIIAINKDPEAPIFKICDIGIVGDVQEVIPKLVADLNRVRRAGSPNGEEAISHL